MGKTGIMGGHHGEPCLNDVGTVQLVWNWDPEKPFETLKDAIFEALMLALPGEQCKYMLHSDASKYAVRAVLLQKLHNGETRGIAFWSRKRMSTKTQYPTCDKELLMIHDAVVNA